MHTSKITDRSSLAAILSSLLAFGIHFHLTQEHIITKYTMGDESPLCNINSYLNCGASIVSSFSEFLGTPIAIFGALTQLLILFFVFKIFLSEEEQEKKIAQKTALVLSIFSLFASLVMASISLFIIKSLCPFCTAAYILSIITLYFVWKIAKNKNSLPLGYLAKPLALSAIILLLGGWATSKVALHKYKSKDFANITSLRIQKWQSEKELKIDLVAPQKFGPDDAKMKIVEFADFLCSHCKMAFPKLHAFAKSNSDVQIIFQTYPLDGCSGSDDNPGRRCDLAKTSYCANLHNKSNEAQEYLYAMQEILAEVSDLNTELSIMYKKLNLDAQQMNDCLKNPQTLAAVKAQLELGKTLDVQGTPALFINNKLFQGGPHIPTLQEVYKNISSQ